MAIMFIAVLLTVCPKAHCPESFGSAPYPFLKKRKTEKRIGNWQGRAGVTKRLPN
jgi:hypothetical protein